MLLGGLHGTPEEQIGLAAHTGGQFLLWKCIGTGRRRRLMFIESILIVQLLPDQIPIGSGFVVVKSTHDSDTPNQTVHFLAVGVEVFLLGFLDGSGRSLKDFGALLPEDTVVLFGETDRSGQVEQLEASCGNSGVRSHVTDKLLTSPTRRNAATNVFIV